MTKRALALWAMAMLTAGGTPVASDEDVDLFDLRRLERGPNFKVAIVDDEPITVEDVLTHVRAPYKTISNLKELPPALQAHRRAELWTLAVRSAATEQILLNAARRQGIEVSAAACDAELAKRIERAGGRERFARAVRDVYGHEREDLDTAIAEYRDRQIRRRMTVDRLLESRRQGLDNYVRPEEMRAYYQTHKAKAFTVTDGVRLKLLIVPAEPPAEARKLAQTLAMLLSKGADFGLLNRMHGRADVVDEHGNLVLPGEKEPRFVDRELTMEEPPTDEASIKLHGMLKKALRDVAWVTPESSYSMPFDTELGVAIIYVEKRRQAEEIPFHKAHDQIRNAIFRDRQLAHDMRSIEELVRKAYVMPPHLYTEPQKPVPLDGPLAEEAENFSSRPPRD